MFGLKSVEQAHTATTFVQRFDSALRLNVHAHVLALDGVYVEQANGALVFMSLPEPCAAEVAEIATRTAKRAAALLEKRGRALGEQGAADPIVEQAALASCYGAAAEGKVPFGERAGATNRRVPPRRRPRR